MGMVPDFQNFSLNRCKALVLEYQKNRKSEEFSLLLARFDRYILHVLYELKDKWYYLREEDLRDLYQTAILGFHKGLLAFKPHLDSSLLILVIKAYVKSEIKQVYSYKEREICCENPPSTASSNRDQANLSSSLMVSSILESPLLTSEEKTILKLRYQNGISVKEIAKQQNMKVCTLYKRLEKIIKKVKKIISPTYI